MLDQRRRAEYDKFGTPMTQRTPINFEARRRMQDEQGRLLMKKLGINLCFSAILLALGFIGGYWAGSILIMADAAYLSADIGSSGISLVSLRLGQRGSTSDLTFGFSRATVIGTMFSVAVIWVATVWLIYEATYRFFLPIQVDGMKMIIVSGIIVG